MRQNLQTLSTELSDMNDKFKYSDEKLILRFQEGDINAYNELVKRYKDRLLNFVLRYFNNVEQAEDVVQDTLIKLYTHASYYKNVAKFSTWIFTIAKNNALTELRKNKRKKTDSLWTDDGQVIDINSKEESLDSKVQNEIAIDPKIRFLICWYLKYAVNCHIPAIIGAIMYISVRTSAFIIKKASHEARISAAIFATFLG